MRLSPELAEYKLFAPEAVRCWRAGTGYALADWPALARARAPNGWNCRSRPAAT